MTLPGSYQKETLSKSTWPRTLPSRRTAPGRSVTSGRASRISKSRSAEMRTFWSCSASCEKRTAGQRICMA